MSATRPAVLSALQTIIKNGVTAVGSRVYLPWDNMPELSNYACIMIDIEQSTIDQEIIGTWTHNIPVKIACLSAGKPDYTAVWDILDSVSSTLEANRNLSGNALTVNITGGDDYLTVNNDKIMWPHISADIMYRTEKGHI